MEAFKPYVWVDENPDASPVLEIRVNCGRNKKIELPLEPQSEEDERLILEYLVVDGSGDDPVTYSLSESSVYDPAVHKKITIKIMDGDVMKGMCTVMPNSAFFS